MKNQEQVQWIFYLTVQRYSVWCFKYVLVFFKNDVDMFLLWGAALVGESTHCCSIPRMLKIYHD